MTDSPSPSLRVLARRLSEVSVVRFGLVGVSNTVLGYTVFRGAHRVAAAADRELVVLRSVFRWYRIGRRASDARTELSAAFERAPADLCAGCREVLHPVQCGSISCRTTIARSAGATLNVAARVCVVPRQRDRGRLFPPH